MLRFSNISGAGDQIFCRRLVPVGYFPFSKFIDGEQEAIDAFKEYQEIIPASSSLIFHDFGEVFFLLCGNLSKLSGYDVLRVKSRMKFGDLFNLFPDTTLCF